MTMQCQGSELSSGNGDASNFHKLAAKLICELEQSILAFSQEVELLRASSFEIPSKGTDQIVSNCQRMQQLIPGDALAMSGKLGQLPKFYELHPSPNKEDSSPGIDVDAWRPLRPMMDGRKNADLDNGYLLTRSRSIGQHSQNDELLPYESSSSNKPKPTFLIEPELLPVIEAGASESPGRLLAQGDFQAAESYCSSPTWRTPKISVRTPQADMNWDLDEIPAEDLWVSQVVEFLTRKCPLCCTKSMSHRLRKWLNWWENLREPLRSGKIYSLVHGNLFQMLILVVIFLNTIFVIITTNIDMDDALVAGDTDASSEKKAWRLTAEASFTAVYCVELILKLYVHRLYLFVERGFRWNYFDFLLVIFSVVDLTFQFMMSSSVKRPNLTFLRALRILKFARVLRVIRIVKCVHELKLMMDCVLNSVIHLFWSVVLILLVLIMFALVIVQGMRDYVVDEYNKNQLANAKTVVEDRFDTVQQTMLSLFMSTTGGVDWGDQYAIVGRAGAFFEFVFVFYIAFFAIVAWNIVMSTFVEKAFRLAMPDFESTVLEKRQETLAYARELTQLLVTKLDTDHDGYISLHEFQSQLCDPKVKDFFAARDLNLKDAQLFFHMLLAVEHTNEVKVETFVGACLRLRGLATAIDLQALHFEVRNLKQKQEHQLLRMETLLRKTVDSLEDGRLYSRGLHKSTSLGSQKSGSASKEIGRQKSGTPSKGRLNYQENPKEDIA